MSTAHQQYEDGAAKETAQGTLALGIDASTGKVRGVSVDADGKLVVSGVAGATSTEYADGAPRGTATGVLAMVDDGVNVQSMAGDANGHPQVGVVALPGVGGLAADDAAASGNPVLMAGKAVAMDGTDPTAVAEGDAATTRTTLDRRVLVTQEHPGAQPPAFHEETGTVTDHELIAAPAAGFRIHIDWITISNDGTAALTAKFEEATAGAKTQLIGTKRLAATCPGVHLYYVGAPIKCTAATNFGMTTTGTTNYSVDVGYHLAP